MGGKLEVDSEEGKGSCFRFTLPFNTCSQPVSVIRDKLRLHALVVNDHDEACKIIARNIRGLGWSVDVVNSSEEAFAYFQAGQLCDLLLVDHGLAEGNGLDTICDLRQHDGLANLPFILLANVHEQERLSTLETKAIIDAILTKPVTQSSLFDAFQEARHAQGLIDIQASSEKTRPGKRLADMRVLVVDDSEVNRVVAQQILGSEGAVVYQVEQGEEALTFLLDESNDDIDLVLMDIQMPVMDGYEATRRLRQHERFKKMPIIALSAGVLQQQRDSALAAGMNAFVPKPFDVEELISKILVLTQKRLTPVEELWQSPRQRTRVESLNDKPDFSVGLAIWQDEQRFKKYLQKFSSEWSRQIKQYDEIAAEDRGKLIHKLKGASGSLGLKALSLLCSRYQEQQQAGNDVDELIAMIRKRLDVTVNAIAEYAPAATDAEDSALDIEAMTSSTRSMLGLTLNAALLAANDDNYDELEAELQKLNKMIPPAMLRPLETALENFDLAEVSQVIVGLSENLGLALPQQQS